MNKDNESLALLNYMPLRKHSILLYFVATLLVSFLALSGFVLAEPGLSFDRKAHDYVETIRSHSLTNVMEIITFFGSQMFLLPAYMVLAALYLANRKQRSAVNILVIGITSTILLFLLKEFFKRPRPLDQLISGVKGFSYPSGHSFSSLTFFGLVVYYILKMKLSPAIKYLAAATLFVLVSAIGFSRIYLGVHYASDVAAGFILSVLWLLLSLFFITRIREKMSVNSSQP